MLLCLLPFIMGLLITDQTRSERMLYNSIFTFSIFLQTMNEYIQIKSDGIREYLKDLFNILDVCMIVLMYVLAILRFCNEGNWLPMSKLLPLMGGPEK